MSSAPQRTTRIFLPFVRNGRLSNGQLPRSNPITSRRKPSLRLNRSE